MAAGREVNFIARQRLFLSACASLFGWAMLMYSSGTFFGKRRASATALRQLVWLGDVDVQQWDFLANGASAPLPCASLFGWAMLIWISGTFFGKRRVSATALRSS